MSNYQENLGLGCIAESVWTCRYLFWKGKGLIKSQYDFLCIRYLSSVCPFLISKCSASVSLFHIIKQFSIINNYYIRHKGENFRKGSSQNSKTRQWWPCDGLGMFHCFRTLKSHEFCCLSTKSWRIMTSSWRALEFCSRAMIHFEWPGHWKVLSWIWQGDAVACP